MHHILLLQSLVDGHLGCFYIWTIRKNAGINIRVLVFCVNMFLVLLPIHVGVELLNPVVTPCFTYLNYQAVFHSSCAIFIGTFPSAKYKRSSFCTALPPLVCLYDPSCAGGCEVVLICVSLMINDVQDLFIGLLVIFMSLLKCLFKFVANVLVRLFAYVLFSCKGLYILDTSPLLDTWLAPSPILIVYFWGRGFNFNGKTNLFFSFLYKFLHQSCLSN